MNGVQGIRCLCERSDVVRNYAYFPIIVEDSYDETRDELYQRLKNNNIFSRKYFFPLTSDQACFKNKYKNLSLENARKLSKRVLVLPFYEEIEEETQKRIMDLILKE